MRRAASPICSCSRSAPAFESGMPEAQTTNRRRHHHRRGRARTGPKSGACRRPVRRQGRPARGAGSVNGRAHDRAGHGRARRLVSSRPQRHHRVGTKVIAQFGELHPKILAAFDLKVPAAGFEIFLDAIPEAKAKQSAHRCSCPRPSRPSSAISLLWWMRKWRQARSSKRPKLADRSADRTGLGVRCL